MSEDLMAPACGAPVRLPVVGGGFTLVDPDIAELLTGVRLYRNRQGRAYLFGHSAGHAQVFLGLHRFVTGAPPGMDVHHRNADKDDNRRANLQVLTPSAHHYLEPRHHGVWLGVKEAHGTFEAAFSRDGHYHFVGYFASRHLAAMARDDAMAEALPGLEFRRNFPKTLRAARLRRALLRMGGRDFRVVFVRRSNGALREMHCRLPTPLEVSAHPPRVDTRARRVVPVIDVDVNEYRFIPLERVLCFQRKDQWVRIDRQRRNRPRPASTASATSSVPTAGSTLSLPAEPS